MRRCLLVVVALGAAVSLVPVQSSTAEVAGEDSLTGDSAGPFQCGSTVCQE